MVRFTDDEVLQLFEDLPRHRGCGLSDLEKVEDTLGVSLPPTYRRLMLLDERRMLACGYVLPVDRLPEGRRNAEELLQEDGFDFRFETNHVVFAWYEVHSFFYFEARGRDDVPVFEFDYCSGESYGLPMKRFPTARTFLVDLIRQYLKL